MAHPLNESPKHENIRELFPEVTVPTFDPITPAGRRARWALLMTSLVALACLLVAIASEHYFKPWRTHQRGFKKLLGSVAVAEGKSPPPFPQEIKQIAAATYGVTDRCTTCHLGYDNPKLAGTEQPFAAHPQWVFDIHPSEQFGCTICHGGQGLATTVEDAHGTTAHWEEPIIPAGYYQAGCGGCHTHTRVPPAGLADYGERMFERYDCFACHRIAGRGRGTGSDLSNIGETLARADWHQLHLDLQEQSFDPVWEESYGPLNHEEITAINAYLDTQMQASALVEAKALVYSKGCLGCHRVNGTGGDEGPDLSLTGKKNPNRLDFTRVEEERNLANWHKAHLLDPALIVPGSMMPQAALTPEELDSVTLYMLSLRGADAPMDRWPLSRLAAERMGTREFATDGQSLFRMFCSSCHGQQGQGIQFGVFSQRFPGVASEEFLAVASDRFILENLNNGRPGRKMPGWGTKEAGLTATEVQLVVAYLRDQQPAAPPYELVAQADVDTQLGKNLYRDNCAICHGNDGDGGIGPALSNQVFLATAEPEFIYQMLINGREDTAMGSQRGLDEREIASLIDHIEKWRKEKTMKLPSLPPATSLQAGRQQYAASCAACHGGNGEGGLAVNLINSSLLAAATDGYLAAAVKYGRCVPPAGSSEGIAAPEVTDQQLADVIAFLRQKAARMPLQAPGRAVQGDIQNGESLFAQACLGCHGERGRNGTAPELANPAFHSAATDGFLQASIIRGRPDAGMPAFGSDSVSYRKLTPEEVNDIVAFIRTLQSD